MTDDELRPLKERADKAEFLKDKIEELQHTIDGVASTNDEVWYRYYDRLTSKEKYLGHQAYEEFQDDLKKAVLQLLIARMDILRREYAEL